MNKDSDNTPSPDDTTEEAISPAPSPGSMSDPLIGTKIGSCTLKRIIGSGGMGTVYEAIQENQRHCTVLSCIIKEWSAPIHTSESCLHLPLSLY